MVSRVWGSEATGPGPQEASVQQGGIRLRVPVGGGPVSHAEGRGRGHTSGRGKVRERGAHLTFVLNSSLSRLFIPNWKGGQGVSLLLLGDRHVSCPSPDVPVS